MAHLVETMAYAGQTPWHELGHALPAKQSIDVWAQAAGMDWRIQETPVRYLATDADSGLSGLYAEPKEFPEQKVLYRSDTQAPLSVVGSRYQVVQPREVLEFYRDLTEVAGYELETAGVLKAGRKFWALARTGKSAALKGNDVVNGYQSQLELWMQKTGKGDLLPVFDPNDDTSPMFWGTMLEPIVAAHYTKRTGNKVRRVNAVLQHSEHPWMLANVDREVVGAGDVQILECKTAGIHGARLWRDGVPEYVQLQVMHQLAVTGHRAADVAVLVGGQELRIFRIERDEALIARLIEMEHAFWQMVESKTPPAGDGSDSAEKALRSLYPNSAGDDVDMSDDPELNAKAQAAQHPSAGAVQ